MATDDQGAALEELARIKADRAALQQARLAREAARSVADELEVERLALADETAIAAAEEAHGPVGKKLSAVRTELGVVIVKRPNHVLFKRFQDGGEATHKEFEKLVRPCVVYPDAAKLDAILEEQPGTLVRLANAVAVLAGVRMTEVSGK